jgi:hypothetical protein
MQSIPSGFVLFGCKWDQPFQCCLQFWIQISLQHMCLKCHSSQDRKYVPIRRETKNYARENIVEVNQWLKQDKDLLYQKLLRLCKISWTSSVLSIIFRTHARPLGSLSLSLVLISSPVFGEPGLRLYPAAFSKFRSLKEYSLSFTDSPKKIPFSISPTLQQRCLNLVLYILPSSKSHLSLKPRPSASVLRRRKQWIQKGERDATFSSTGGHPLK